MAYGIPGEALERLVALLRADQRIQAALLYGSRARGTAQPASDIDLCLVAPELGYADLARIEAHIDDLLLPWRVDLSLLHQLDNPELLTHIRQLGVDLLAPLATDAH